MSKNRFFAKKIVETWNFCRIVGWLCTKKMILIYIASLEHTSISCKMFFKWTKIKIMGFHQPPYHNFWRPPYPNDSPKCQLRPNKVKTSMFPVARVHSILTTKFARSFFNDVCIHKSLECRKKYDTTWSFDLNVLKTYCVYFFKSNIWVYFWLMNIKKDTTPTCLFLCVCLPVLAA